MNRGDVTAGIGAVLLMSVCCGGPLLVLAGAAIGPALLSVVGVPLIVGLAVGLAAVIGIVLWRRRASTECTSQPSKTNLGVERVRRIVDAGRPISQSPDGRRTASTAKGEERRDPASVDDSGDREIFIVR